jgi:hypothetical protein
VFTYANYTLLRMRQRPPAARMAQANRPVRDGNVIEEQA